MGAGSGFLNQFQNSTNQLTSLLNQGQNNLSGAPTTTPNAVSEPVATVSNVASNPTTTATPTATPTTTATTTSNVTPVTGDANTATLGTGQTSNPFNAATNPYIQAAQATTMGNLYGAQAATQANRINQATPYANLQYTRGVDANGNPTWTASQSLNPMFQGTLSNLSQNAQQATQNPLQQANLQTNVGGTGTEGWDRATQLIMNRLQPQMAQQAESQKAALANQGIVPGTQAYENAMRTFNQGQNDLLTSAQMQGANLQNQLFGQNLQAGQFGNQAQQQMFANRLAAQNAPLQQLGAFQSATNPNYINPYTQAAVSGPDYLGAYTTSRAADIAQQNAQAAKTANLQNGLFGLGSSAILGAGGIGNLGSSILGGATTLGGLLGLGGTPGLGQTTNWLGQVVSDPTYGAGTAYNAMTPDEISNMMEWGL